MIRVAQDGPISTITLDRADKRNAMTPEMLSGLIRAIGAVDRASETRAVVLEGEGSVFCAGFDLSLCAASADGSVMRELLTGLSEVIAAMRECPCPVVIAAQGAAIAGGCAILGGADVVVADRGMKLGYPVLRIGVSPAVSGPYMAARAGFGAARARMLDTDLATAEQGRACGLVHEVVDEAARVRPRAMAIARELAGKPGGAMAATKRWLNEIEDAGRRLTPADGLAASIGLTGGSEEAEGVRQALSRA